MRMKGFIVVLMQLKKINLLNPVLDGIYCVPTKIRLFQKTTRCNLFCGCRTVEWDDFGKVCAFP